MTQSLMSSRDVLVGKAGRREAFLFETVPSRWRARVASHDRIVSLTCTLSSYHGTSAISVGCGAQDTGAS